MKTCLALNNPHLTLGVQWTLIHAHRLEKSSPRILPLDCPHPAHIEWFKSAHYDSFIRNDTTNAEEGTGQPQTIAAKPTAQRSPVIFFLHRRSRYKCCQRTLKPVLSSAGANKKCHVSGVSGLGLRSPHPHSPLSEVGQPLPFLEKLWGCGKILCSSRPLLVLAIHTQSSNLLSELTCLRIRLGAFLTREVKHVLLQGATSLQQVCLPNCKGLSIDPEVILNKDQRCKMADNTDSFQYKLPPCKCHLNPCSLLANKIMHDNAVNCAVEPWKQEEQKTLLRITMIEALQLMPSPAFRFWACLVEMYSGVFSKRSRAAVRAFFLRSTSSWLRAL